MKNLKIQGNGMVQGAGNIFLVDGSRAGIRAAGIRAIVKRVHEGLISEQFGLVFQPIWHARNASVTSVECLLRWHHPTYGVLLPGAFRHAFSDEALARETFYFVFESACRELAVLEERNQKIPTRIAVNMEPSVLVDEKLIERITAITGHYHVDPSRFDFEIIETEDASTLLSLREFTDPLKGLGIRLMCDDFGSAYPPFSTLSSMRIDGVKIDKSFLRGIPTGERSCIVLEALLDLCARLQLRVVVEGVESGAQLEWLTARGDIEVQGFYIGRPQAQIGEVYAHLPRAVLSDKRAGY
ncbi:EAL domain-containing protein [Cupriavidus basilensis]|uniref:EAL domain-containing protein n=1 Tax=Cupriavidus basilensis TaxID=68895 RepID=A0ABT6B2Q7_9BURK|nr:EAL domain-containing protein [Cupriavidus basilensis]MDF3839162.1 EAL domain-containing protein [Cupriavidus basilensis]